MATNASHKRSGAVELELDWLRPSNVVDFARFKIRLQAGDLRDSDAQIVGHILAVEGSKYTNHPSDLGGPTKYGITIPAWSGYIGRQATAADIQRLTQRDAEGFYRTVHVRPFDILLDPLRLQVIDLGVHRGVRTAVKELQKVAGVDVDGWIGQQTAAAVAALGNERVNNLLVGSRLAHFENLIARDARQSRWRNGWRKRALNFYVEVGHAGASIAHRKVA